VLGHDEVPPGDELPGLARGVQVTRLGGGKRAERLEVTVFDHEWLAMLL
jgi:hypothetical protein